MDKICLTGIRCYGYSGALSEEQVLGQWFEVDLTLGLDLSRPGETDRLEDTLDYRQVITTTQHLVKTAKFALLERLATAIADAILDPAELTQRLPLQQVCVRLSKLAAPIPDFGGRITVEITRQRPTDGSKFK